MAGPQEFETPRGLGCYDVCSKGVEGQSYVAGLWGFRVMDGLGFV